MNFKGHPLYDELVSLGIIDPGSILPYFPRVRDREDVAALRCGKSGVIFLDRIDHVAQNYYAEQEGLNYWSKDGRTAGLELTHDDDERRATMIRPLVKGKVFADVGTGLGGILDMVRSAAREVYAVEPQQGAREMLADLGYKTHASTDELARSETKCDVISLFHVFEHLVEPIAELKRIREAMAPGGQIIIEVPHALDALLSTYDLDTFRAFTLWSEHLVLHTRASLMKYLTAAGFTSVEVNGFQRYPLANHLYWLKHGKPGGQEIWKELRDAEAERTYAAMLKRLDRTDTLIVQGRVA